VNVNRHTLSPYTLTV